MSMNHVENTNIIFGNMIVMKNIIILIELFINKKYKEIKRKKKSSHTS